MDIIGEVSCESLLGVKGLILVCVTFNRKALLRNKRNQRKRRQKVKRKRNIRNTRNMGVRNTNISVQNTRNTKTRTSHLGLVVTYVLTLRLKRNFQLSIESRPVYCIGFGFFRSVIGLKKTRATLSTKQMQNLNQLRIGHPCCPALLTACLIDFDFSLFPKGISLSSRRLL